MNSEYRHWRLRDTKRSRVEERDRKSEKERETYIHRERQRDRKRESWKKQERERDGEREGMGNSRCDSEVGSRQGANFSHLLGLLQGNLLTRSLLLILLVLEMEEERK